MQNTTSNSIRIESLDGLRGVLAILVCFAHAWQVFVYPFDGDSLYFWLLGIIARGAVLCFFCLSGFVITLSIEKNIQRNYGFKQLDYLSSRFWRIAPPLVSIILATYVVSQILALLDANIIPQNISSTRHFYGTNVTSQLVCLFSACAYGELTGNWFNGPLWSLAFEIQLYAISGMIAWVLFAAKNHLHCSLGVGVLIVYTLHVLGFGEGLVFNRQVVAYTCYFFGTITYLMRNKLKIEMVKLTVIGLCLLAGSIYIYASIHHNYADMESPIWLLFQVVMGGIFSILIFKFSKMNLMSKLESLGAYSYTLYIFHFPLMLLFFFFAFKYSPQILSNYYYFNFALSVVIVIFLSQKVGLMIEQPKKQRQYFSNQLLLTKRFFQK